MFWLILILAADPVAKITGPAKAKPGDLVILSADGSVATGYGWALPGSTKSILAVDGGKRCVFASGEPGRYVFVLAVAQDGKPAIAVHTLEIEGGVPPTPPSPPAPGPGPSPVPGPALPDGKYRMAAFAFAEAAKIQSPARAAEAAKIADILEAKAGELAGVGGEPDAAVAAVRHAAAQACGVNDVHWQSWWRAAAAKMRESQIGTKPAMIAAFSELASGLRAVK